MRAIVIHAAHDLRIEDRESEAPGPGEAAMAEPLAVALHATRRAGGMVGKSVLVTGCGPIGILAILAARRGGRGPTGSWLPTSRPSRLARRAKRAPTLR